MKKRTALIAAALSLMPLGQPLVVGTSAFLMSAGLMLSFSGKAQAESADFYFNRAIDKQDKGDDYGAISDYTKAIKINPSFSIAYYNRGNAKGDLEDYEGAISDYTKVIEINPKDADAYFNRGLAKGKLEDYYGEISDYNKTIEINPRYAKAYHNRGIAKSNLDDEKGACKDYKKAMSLGSKLTEEWLATEGGAWCRNM